jgi:two-component system response regulator MtrA
MTGSTTILLVEDDESLGRQIADQLGRAGFVVDWLRDGAEALLRQPESYALWILDLMLPGAYGLDIVKHVRRTSDVPVLMLSGQGEASVKVQALKLGADDYLTKPFWPQELLARVQARLRRPVALREGRIELGELAVDLGARRAFARGAELELTRVEFDLLAALVRKAGTVVPRGQLAEQVLDPTLEGTERTLDVHVSRLRKKLGELAGYLTTVRGVGYRIEAADAGGAEPS